MVTATLLLAASEAGEQSESVLQQLEPGRRVAVIMALVGLVLILVFFLIAIPLGGRIARRYGTSSRPKAEPTPRRKASPTARRIKPSHRQVTSDTIHDPRDRETQASDD